jgi:fucose 4-O-acetylase-like acetyltransferase
MSKERLAYIDIARGIGILLVVLAHNNLAGYAPFLHHLIYSFHMPLFFFLSGLFFKPEMPFWSVLARRLDTLVKPFFFTIFLIYFFEVFYDNMGLPVAFSRIVKAFYANGYYLDWVATWFLPALFTVNMFAFLFYLPFRWTQNPWPRWIGLVAVLVLGAWTVGWFNPVTVNLLGRSLVLKGLPWSLDLMLLAGFFFIMGREVYRGVPQDWFSSIWMLLGAATLNLGLNFAFTPTMDFNTRSYDLPVVFTLEALAGIAFVLAFSRQIERGPAWLASLLAYFGRISIIILIFHNPVQSYLTGKIEFILGESIYTPLFVYPFAVGAPVLIYELGIKHNPVVSKLFGLKSQ